MDENKAKAWEYLVDNEKQSIYLTLGQGLSGCEAGEILGMTHYKYLELKARSETFFKIFSDYFEKHRQLIRPNNGINPAFRDYIYACLEKRLPLQEAIIFGGEGSWSTQKIRYEEITSSMALLMVSENQWDQDLFKLIIEFDRYNNFRILPYELQAPSPYKRKSNRQAKAYFRYLRGIPRNTLIKLTKTLWYNSKKVWYIALISDSLWENGYGIIPIQQTKANMQSLTIQRIYIFNEQIFAEQFALMVIRQPHVLTPKDGLIFWKDYQSIIQNALNYENIDHTTKIKDFYDESFKNQYCRPSSKRLKR